MNILSIQSWVTCGHVGNAAALFPLQRLGAEVWAINTVQFSNHPGYGRHTGRITGGPAVAALIDGIEEVGFLGRLDAILSGYLGDAATGTAVLDAVARARRIRPDLLYCCDPVMGDAGPGLYVAPGIATLLARQAVPAADILTPNQYELGLLLSGSEIGAGACRAGAPLADIAGAAAAVSARMRAAGPGLVLVTSVQAQETPADAIDLLLAMPMGCATLRTPRLDLSANGAGDLLAGLFLLHLLRTADPVAAFEQAASSVWGVLRQTVRAGGGELRIVQAQGEFERPQRRFVAERF